MKLRDRQLLISYMEKKDFSQSRLGRYADCSRQFIHQLVKGDVSTCSDKTGRLIEEALDLLPGTLFVSMESLGTGHKVAPRATRQKVAA